MKNDEWSSDIGIHRREDTTRTKSTKEYRSLPWFTEATCGLLVNGRGTKVRIGMTSGTQPPKRIERGFAYANAWAQY